jgi:hypothetical protein
MEQHHRSPGEDGVDVTKQKRTASGMAGARMRFARVMHTPTGEKPQPTAPPLSEGILDLRVGPDVQEQLELGRWLAMVSIRLDHDLSVKEFDELEGNIEDRLEGRDPMTARVDDTLVSWFDIESANDDRRMTVTKFARSVAVAMGQTPEDVLMSEITFVDTAEIDRHGPAALRGAPYQGAR